MIALINRQAATMVCVCLMIYCSAETTGGHENLTSPPSTLPVWDRLYGWTTNSDIRDTPNRPTFPNDASDTSHEPNVQTDGSEGSFNGKSGDFNQGSKDKEQTQPSPTSQSKSSSFKSTSRSSTTDSPPHGVASNEWFILDSDFDGNPPIGDICRSACYNPRLVPALLRHNYALSQCDCSEVDAAILDAGTAQEKILARLETFASFLSTFEMIQNSSVLSLFSYVVTANTAIACFTIEVAVLFGAGYLPGIWPIMFLIATTIFGVLYGIQLWSWGSAVSYALRFCFMILGGDIGINQQHLYTSALAMLFVSSLSVLLTNYVQVICVSAVMLASSFGGVAAMVDSSFPSSVEGNKSNASRGIIYLLTMRFFHVTSAAHWASINTLSQTATGETERYVIMFAILISCLAGGKLGGYFSIVSTFAEVNLIMKCAPFAIVSAFVNKSGEMSTDAYLMTIFSLCFSLKILGYFLVRLVASGHDVPYLCSRKDIKYDKTSTIVPGVYYARFVVFICSSLVAKPHKEYGITYAITLQIVNLHYILGHVDVFVMFTFLGWISNLVVSFVTPELRNTPIIFIDEKKEKKEKKKEKVKDIKQLSAISLSREVGSFDDDRAFDVSDWEFEKESSADALVNSSDSHVTNDDISDMHWTTKAIRTCAGRANSVCTGPDEMRTVSHAYANDFDDLRSYTLDQFTTHIDGKNVTPISVSYYNHDKHAKEAVLILHFAPNTLDPRSRYIRPTPARSDSVAIIMFGTDGYRIDDKTVINTAWGTDLLRYRFLTIPSDSGKGLFTVPRSGRVGLIGLHFAKSDTARGNVGLLAYPHTDITVLVSDEHVLGKLAPHNPIPDDDSAPVSNNFFKKQLQKLTDNYTAFVKDDSKLALLAASLQKLIAKDEEVEAAKRARNKLRNQRVYEKRKLQKQNKSSADPNDPVSTPTDTSASSASSNQEVKTE